jgi:hypothetical protein
MTMVLEEFYITLPVLPTNTAVMEYVEQKAEPPREPVWALLCASLGGLAMIGSGAFFIALGVLTR